MGEPIVGIASMYNPCAPGTPSGGAETASGELYDAEGWTAAIQIDLRTRFGGVRYGRNYRPRLCFDRERGQAGDREDQRRRAAAAWPRHRPKRAGDALFRPLARARAGAESAHHPA